MKWFIILFVIVGGYYYMLLNFANMALKGTQQLQQRYTTVADHADQIAGGSISINR